MTEKFCKECGVNILNPEDPEEDDGICSECISCFKHEIKSTKWGNVK